MFGHLSYMDRDLTRGQKVMKVLKGLCGDAAQRAKKNPILATSAALLSGTLAVYGINSSHEESVQQKAQTELTQRQSPLASVDVLGINRIGFIHQGVIALKETDKPEQAAINALLQKSIKANDMDGGCQFATLRTNYAASGPLAHIFSGAVKVEHFNNPAFANGAFTCTAPAKPANNLV